MQVCSHIARLFCYPDRDFREVIDLLHSELWEYGVKATELFLPVKEHFTDKPVSELQEYYITTFDVNAACYLDIGYVLFGEESKRGQFLLNMKSEQVKAENDCGTEFPDHLPNVLTLLPKIRDLQFREELVVIMLLPALGHMLENFRTDQNIYRNLIMILITVLESSYKNSILEPYKINQKEIESSGIYACGMDITKMNNKKY
jgi:nitrate reductase assembly molybdenum cofactor insertion protein NarJ